MTQVGDRVELIYSDDQYTRLAPGELGTVTFIDSMGTVFVDWDSGSKLGLVREGGDRWKVIQGTRTASEMRAADSLSAKDVLNEGND